MATQSCSTASELVGGTNPEAPYFSALTLREVSANVKGHQALKRRAALRPSEEILEESAKERMQVRMRGQQRLLSVLSTSLLPPLYPRPWLCFLPQPQPRLFYGGTGGRCKASGGGRPHTDTAPQKALQSGLSAPQTGLECRTDTGTRPAGQTHAWLPSFFPVWTPCAAGKVMGREGNGTGFQFPVETGFPVPAILIKDDAQS